MFWLQTFKYERNLNGGSDLLNPLEASISKSGDMRCQITDSWYTSKEIGYKQPSFNFRKAKHAIIAVDCSGDGLSYEYKGKKYLMIELTTKALIGDVDESFSNPDIWTPVEMEYTNGY